MKILKFFQQKEDLDKGQLEEVGVEVEFVNSITGKTIKTTVVLSSLEGHLHLHCKQGRLVLRPKNSSYVEVEVG